MSGEFLFALVVVYYHGLYPAHFKLLSVAGLQKFALAHLQSALGTHSAFYNAIAPESLLSAVNVARPNE